jgi:hypothetical protein
MLDFYFFPVTGQKLPVAGRRPVKPTPDYATSGNHGVRLPPTLLKHFQVFAAKMALFIAE